MQAAPWPAALQPNSCGINPPEEAPQVAIGQVLCPRSRVVAPVSQVIALVEAASDRANFPRVPAKVEVALPEIAPLAVANDRASFLRVLVKAVVVSPVIDLAEAANDRASSRRALAAMVGRPTTQVGLTIGINGTTIGKTIGIRSLTIGAITGKTTGTIAITGLTATFGTIILAMVGDGTEV